MSVGPDEGDYRGCLFVPATLSCPDIAATGTLVTVPDDGNSALIDLGFTFDYYDRSFTKVAIQGNGALTFVAEPLGSYNTTSIPKSAPFDVIAIYWDSLRPNFNDRGDADPDNDLGIEGSNIRYQKVGTSPNRMFVVRWDAPVKTIFSDQRGVFTAVLHENGDISGCYEDTTFSSSDNSYNLGNTATVALMRSDNVLVLTHNDPNLPSGTEVRFTPR